MGCGLSESELEDEDDEDDDEEEEEESTHTTCLYDLRVKQHGTGLRKRMPRTRRKNYHHPGADVVKCKQTVQENCVSLGFAFLAPDVLLITRLFGQLLHMTEIRIAPDMGAQWEAPLRPS